MTATYTFADLIGAGMLGTMVGLLAGHAIHWIARRVVYGASR